MSDWDRPLTFDSHLPSSTFQPPSFQPPSFEAPPAFQPPSFSYDSNIAPPPSYDDSAPPAYGNNFSAPASAPLPPSLSGTVAAPVQLVSNSTDVRAVVVYAHENAPSRVARIEFVLVNGSKLVAPVNDNGRLLDSLGRWELSDGETLACVARRPKSATSFCPGY